jgi:hypothetical protein
MKIAFPVTLNSGIELTACCLVLDDMLITLVNNELNMFFKLYRDESAYNAGLANVNADFPLNTNVKVEGSNFTSNVIPRLSGSGSLLNGIRTFIKNRLKTALTLTDADFTDLD